MHKDARRVFPEQKNGKKRPDNPPQKLLRSESGNWEEKNLKNRTDLNLLIVNSTEKRQKRIMTNR